MITVCLIISLLVLIAINNRNPRWLVRSDRVENALIVMILVNFLAIPVSVFFLVC